MRGALLKQCVAEASAKDSVGADTAGLYAPSTAEQLAPGAAT